MTITAVTPEAKEYIAYYTKLIYDLGKDISSEQVHKLIDDVYRRGFADGKEHMEKAVAADFENLVADDGELNNG